MSPKLKELFEEASSLSDEERATLAGLLIETLDSEWDPGAQAAWSEEIQRRTQELEAGAVQTIPWEQVRTRLLERLNGS